MAEDRLKHAAGHLGRYAWQELRLCRDRFFCGLGATKPYVAKADPSVVYGTAGDEKEERPCSHSLVFIKPLANQSAVLGQVVDTR